MVNRDDMAGWVKNALEKNGGSGTLIEVAKYIWDEHKGDLKDSHLFYTWQYDMRWGATQLRKQGIMKSAKDSPRGVWELV